MFNHAGFFFARDGARRSPPAGANPMNKSNSTVAQQIAQAATHFVHQTTGHVPRSVAVVLNEDTAGCPL
jgi:hypothetical protein